MKKTILIIAGDPSGDLYGARLAKAIARETVNKNIMGYTLAEQEDSEAIHIYGLGGRNMRDAGIELIATIVDLSVVGFSEVIEHIWTLRKIFKRLTNFLIEKRPKAVVLIDYPGFNLKVAKLCKKLDIAVIYYVSPQIWAWWSSRIKTIGKLVKKVLVILPFEMEIYKRENIDVSFVGHPLLELIKPTKNSEEIFKELDLNMDSPVIGILPGSRKGEVKRLLPPMLEIAKKIKEEIPNIQFILPVSLNLSMGYILKIMRNKKEYIRIVRDKSYNARSIMNVCMVASGSATLENACLGIPMVVMYSVSQISYLLAKIFVKIPDIALVNILAGKRIVPEFVQGQIDTTKIVGIIKNWLKNREDCLKIKKELCKVRERLGESGASERAAKLILEEIK